MLGISAGVPRLNVKKMEVKVATAAMAVREDMGRGLDGMDLRGISQGKEAKEAKEVKVEADAVAVEVVTVVTVVVEELGTSAAEMEEKDRGVIMEKVTKRDVDIEEIETEEMDKTEEVLAEHRAGLLLVLMELYFTIYDGCFPFLGPLNPYINSVPTPDSEAVIVVTA